ncbi:hypothetical protein [Phytoactinopolyspora mesophila]|uniref:Uncharacterized protein n=1 Tax=Phytoactinopolyspora mesophila TaxID=2650750 RepID=A0A7K3MAT5_9ACTN|nr:hypothetical protein [Phytoactinopolyspora mesophila]NDL59508.1 hypothetical protein [Phytoactinopolyspora mesophila]
MTAPAEPLPSGGPIPPDADPAIRARLSWRIAVEVDAEWGIVPERTKQSKDLSAALIAAPVSRWLVTVGRPVGDLRDARCIHGDRRST